MDAPEINIEPAPEIDWKTECERLKSENEKLKAENLNFETTIIRLYQEAII